MARNPKPLESNTTLLQRPGTSPEDEENKCISLATKLAKQQLEDGTASSQVITHYLKLGTAKEKLEIERTKQEVELMKAKRKALESAQHSEEMFQQAIEAFRSYGGGSIGRE